VSNPLQYGDDVISSLYISRVCVLHFLAPAWGRAEGGVYTDLLAPCQLTRRWFSRANDTMLGPLGCGSDRPHHTG